MSEISKYEAYKKKLQGICDEHELVFRLRHDTYPITLTVSPTSGVGEQLSLLAGADGDEPYMSPDASLMFYVKDGELGYKISEAFNISDTLFSKLKNLFKNLFNCWLQYFFREIIESGSLKAGTMPVIDESEAEDYEEPDDDDEDNGDAEESEDGAVISLDEHLIAEATALVRAENKATTSLLQRRLNVGYAKAAQIMDELESRGVIGAYNGGSPREVLPADVPEA